MSVAAALALLAVGAAPAIAAGPQWTISAISSPTNIDPAAAPGEDSYTILVTNTGSGSSSGPVQITEELPAELTVDPNGISGENTLAKYQSLTPSAGFTCGLATCTYTPTVVADQTLVLTVPLDVSAATGETLTNVIRVSGGGAAAARDSISTRISADPAPFEIPPGAATASFSTLQAGAHPDITNTFGFSSVTAEGTPRESVKDVVYRLPAGFASDFAATPECEAAQFLIEECPLTSQVGVTTVNLLYQERTKREIRPVYNLVPDPGHVAAIGFSVAGQFLVEGEISLEPRSYEARIAFSNIDQTLTQVIAGSLTIWGVPASPVHDPLRLGSIGGGVVSFGHPSSANPTPFFTNPTSCAAARLESSFQVDPWEEPGAFRTTPLPFGPITGCDRLTIEPKLETTPTSTSAESATGLDASLESPQHYVNPEGLVASHLDLARVTLPEGMSLNPSAGSGLGSCTRGQLEYEAGTFAPVPGLGCPNESKVGSVRIHSPALAEEAEGSLFVARPFENPFGSLLALYLVARIPDRGVVVTSAGEVHADPTTGQLTTTFNENPQLPFDHLALDFRQGATSPLVTPPTCGHFTTAALLTPWSVPTQEHLLSSSFDVTSGVGGGACPSGATPPFHPGLVAGSEGDQAGAYSPFYLELSRSDGEQEITHLSIKLPPGELASLAGVTKCSDSAIAQAKSREHEQGGGEEEASPSCPASSEVGHTLVEAGVGSVLAQAPGHIYLAGPYHGAPISLVSITSAKVGPFDLGTVVVRFALKVDPETTAVSVDGQGSDPIPHIIDGIPVHLRNIRTYVDRPHFSLNPTSCKATSTASTVVGSGRSFTSEADDQPVTVTSPFQPANCASLAFKPTLKLQLKGGKTSRGGLPGLKATLTARPGDANIGMAQVTLPPSEFLEQGHLKDVCPRSIWVQGTVPGERCPAKSIYGHARATTPLLSEPLSGPVYLRTGYGTKLPQLVAALNAQEINVDVVGEIDSVHQKHSEVSLLRNTFKTVPDAPVTKFELELKGGKKGLLVNSQNVCKGTHKALAAFTGQNGKLSETEPKLTADCGKGGKGKKSKGGGKKGTGK